MLQILLNLMQLPEAGGDVTLRRNAHFNKRSSQRREEITGCSKVNIAIPLSRYGFFEAFRSEIACKVTFAFC